MTADALATTRKETAFIAAFLVCLNASEAARQAGYSHKTARETGHTLLSKPHIKEKIQAAMDARFAGLDVKAHRVLSQLAEMAFTSVEASEVWKIQKRRVDRDEATEEKINKNLATTDLSIDVLRKIERDGIKRQEKALESLCKALRIFQDLTVTQNNTQINVSTQFAPLTTAQLVALAQSRMKPVEEVEEGEEVPALEPGKPRDP